MSQINRRSFLSKSAKAGLLAFGASIFSGKILGISLKAVSKLVLIKGTDYFGNTLKAIELLGGIEKFVPKGSKVGLLINSPWKNPGSYTNPDICLAVIDACNKAGASEIYTLKEDTVDYWKRSKLFYKYSDQVAKMKTIPGYNKVRISGSKKLQEAEITKSLEACDVLINIPIGKHHSGTNFSGNLKNMMGLCPYSTNRYLHSPNGEFSYNNPDYLSQTIADLNLVRKPDLCIADVTQSLLNNGPAGPGEMIKPQAIIAGTDPVAIDTLAVKTLEIELESVPTIKYAHDLGIGSMNISEAEILEV